MYFNKINLKDGEKAKAKLKFSLKSVEMRWDTCVPLLLYLKYPELKKESKTFQIPFKVKSLQSLSEAGNDF